MGAKRAQWRASNVQMRWMWGSGNNRRAPFFPPQMAEQRKNERPLRRASSTTVDSLGNAFTGISSGDAERNCERIHSSLRVTMRGEETLSRLISHLNIEGITANFSFPPLSYSISDAADAAAAANHPSLSSLAPGASSHSLRAQRSSPAPAAVRRKGGSRGRPTARAGEGGDGDGDGGGRWEISASIGFPSRRRTRTALKRPSSWAKVLGCLPGYWHFMRGGSRDVLSLA